MIEKEFGKYVGVCDACGETTPRFDTWDEVRAYMKQNWKTTKNKETGEYENYCSVCKNL